jgi:chromosome segregation ATPase
MTDAREIAVEEIVPCMDAWCKISPCTCRDGINVLIAERDKLKAELELADKANYEHSEFNRKLEAERDKLHLKLGAAVVERDNLKEEVERLTNLRHYNAEALWKQNDALVERVSVLEGALEEVAVFAPSDDCDLQRLALIARAALRTSEDA